MKKFDYILFDVAGTLLYKPTFYETFVRVLKNYGYEVNLKDFKLKHKILSEAIHFPDRTNRTFYRFFNSELLFSLGILPSDRILDEIFDNCSYLLWDKYEDTAVISELNLGVGIISNFNTTLESKLNEFFGPIFKHIIVSEEVGVAKPNVEFYKKALEITKVEPDRILYIGDSMKLDIEPALSIGINSLLIDRYNFYKSSKFRINSLRDILKYIN